MPFDYIRSEGTTGHLGQQLIAIAAKGPQSSVYLTPTVEHEQIAIAPQPQWAPETDTERPIYRSRPLAFASKSKSFGATVLENLA